MSMTKDWYLLGLTTGMASSIVKTTANYLAHKAGLATQPYGALAGSMVLGKRKGNLWTRTTKASGAIDEHMVGVLADVVFGGIFGVVSSFIYTTTPPGNEIIKGALGGATLWALSFTVPNQMMVSRMKPKQMITLLGTDILYGVAQGALIGRFGKKLARQAHPKLAQPAPNREFSRAQMMARRGWQALM